MIPEELLIKPLYNEDFNYLVPKIWTSFQGGMMKGSHMMFDKCLSVVFSHTKGLVSMLNGLIKLARDSTKHLKNKAINLKQTADKMTELVPATSVSIILAFNHVMEEPQNLMF